MYTVLSATMEKTKSWSDVDVAETADDDRIERVDDDAERGDQHRAAHRQHERGGGVHEDVERGELRAGVLHARDVHDRGDDEQIDDQLAVEKPFRQRLSITSVQTKEPTVKTIVPTSVAAAMNVLAGSRLEPGEDRSDEDRQRDRQPADIHPSDQAGEDRVTTRYRLSTCGDEWRTASPFL